MEQAIAGLFKEYFGFFPDILSTTEHAYISPPSRIISSLKILSEFSGQQILRIVLTDKYSIHPENSVRQICIPHLLNKRLFLFQESLSPEEQTNLFQKDADLLKAIADDQLIFSLAEKENYEKLINLYTEILQEAKNEDRVLFYKYILEMYLKELGFCTLNEWSKRMGVFGVDSEKVRDFLKESFKILAKQKLIETNLFGEYLEKSKRLKFKDVKNNMRLIDWQDYLSKLQNNSISVSIPFEIILFVYSYCGGAHFGNDYGMVDAINKINHTRLLQLTEHNKDFRFNPEEKNIQFYKATYLNNSWNLSHKILKNVNTLSELYVLLGAEGLKNKLKESW